MLEISKATLAKVAQTLRELHEQEQETGQTISTQIVYESDIGSVSVLVTDLISEPRVLFVADPVGKQSAEFTQLHTALVYLYNRPLELK